MVASIRDIISVSRKTARNLKQALEEITEQYIANRRQKELEAVLERIPVKNTQPKQDLLANRLRGRRNFSTAARRNFSGVKAPSGSLYKSLGTTRVTTASRNLINLYEPFRLATRVTTRGLVRGGPGSSLFNNLPRQSARLYSTQGHTVAADAVGKISEAVRAVFLKGSSLNIKGSVNHNIGSIKSNENYVNKDIELAQAESSSTVASGCFVDFNFDRSFNMEDYLPQKVLLGPESVDSLRKFYDDVAAYRAVVTNDIEKMVNLIGEPSAEYIMNGRHLKIRCRFPNCEPQKMERLLLENEIVSGVVMSDDSAAYTDECSSSEFYSQMSDSNSGSESSFFEMVEQMPSIASGLSSTTSYVTGNSDPNGNESFFYNDVSILSSRGLDDDGLQFIETVIPTGDFGDIVVV
ncbi:hypothetical protein CANARDRAFT_6558 [[Candida] arabinofermentans NRRL YB-2248]|uniref:Uncharacterized protein n=1 Tax=[Candida] arabinofermentans NRRL YB-2248 TaxID=983967 RepID=A0A1E4T5Q5_9ASCO|nr:hypothetical protein CANARDRAFT_6558 [[Candida] arabinofermentans NRRL YB-2248]